VRFPSGKAKTVQVRSLLFTAYLSANLSRVVATECEPERRTEIAKKAAEKRWAKPES